MMQTLSQMNNKIEHVKKRLQNDHIDNKKHKTDEITHKLIQSKESSEIITKENLLSDITECTFIEIQHTRRQSLRSTLRTVN